MKIGIITFWNSQDNYGQLLQCYALQHYLKKEGHEPFLIRYIPQMKGKTKFERLLRLWKVFSPKYLKAYKQMLNDKKKSTIFEAANPRYFDEFRANNIKMSQSIFYTLEDLINESWDVDAFICGSDQIWSYSPVIDNIKAYFLQFAPKNTKAIAYAASFGRPELPNDYSKILPSLLDRFASIGLREETGVDLCKKANRSDSKLVCDPTILLNGEDYILSIVKKKITEKDIAFAYLLNWEMEFPLDEIKSFIKIQDLQMNFFGAHGMEYKNLFQSADDLSISFWLDSMASSKYVFTNSFHGTVLAILLNRSFIAFPLVGKSSRMNDRLITLLDRVGLKNRLYTSGKSIDDIFKETINWSEVNCKIDDFRIESQQFLKEALNK